MKYRYVGDHAEVLDDGTPVGPGDDVEITDDNIKQPHAAALLEEGLLIAKGTSKKEGST